jgi:Ca2+-binding RTX toxin-like protein
MVSNSQWHHGTNVNLFIEDQPLLRGSYTLFDAQTYWDAGSLVPINQYSQNDFGDTHSLVLIVDTLNVQNTLKSLDTSVEPGTLNALLQAASARQAKWETGTQGKAEGDVLEWVVDALAFALTGNDPELRNENAANGQSLNTGGTWADKTLREKFYTQLDLIQKAITDNQLAGKLKVTVANADLATAARTDFAAFLSLYGGFPLGLKSVTGQEDAVSAILGGKQGGDLYGNWSADKDLTPAERAAGKAYYSDQYLADRAAYLASLAAANTGNTGEDKALWLTTPSGEPIYFKDIASGISIETEKGNRAGRQYLFGGKDDDSGLTGGDKDDRIYGGAGSDTLDGGNGADYLEGGSGNDTYQIGSGKDRIVDKDGTIKLGTAILTGSPNLAQVTKPSLGSSVWKDANDAHLFYRLKDGTLEDGTLEIVKEQGNKLETLAVVEHFKNGNLGLTLKDQKKLALLSQSADRPFTPDNADQPLPTQPLSLAEGLGQGLKVFLNTAAKAGDTITLALSALGDKFKAVLGDDIVGFDSGNVTLTLTEGQTEVSFAFLNTGDVDVDQTLTLTATLQAADGSSNVVNTLAINFDANTEIDNSPSTSNTIIGDQRTTTGIPSIDHRDELYGTAANDLILAGEESDRVGGNSGDDRIEGGNDVDVVGGDDGNDWLLGQADRDVVAGGMGDDRLFGEGETTLAQGLLDGNQNTGSGQDGDWLLGNEGKDSLIASAANDLLEGGDGADILVGGAGDDMIEGDGDLRWVYNGQGPGTLVTQFNQDADGSTSVTISPSGNIVRFNNIAPGADVIYAGNGNDLVLAGGGDDLVYGEAGRDNLFGDAGNDVLLGGAGDDNLSGDNGNSVLAYAQHGNDFLDGGEGEGSRRNDKGLSRSFGEMLRSTGKIGQKRNGFGPLDGYSAHATEQLREAA